VIDIFLRSYLPHWLSLARQVPLEMWCGLGLWMVWQLWMVVRFVKLSPRALDNPRERL